MNEVSKKAKFWDTHSTCAIIPIVHVLEYTLIGVGDCP